jgi:hypothetical protein
MHFEVNQYIYGRNKLLFARAQCAIALRRERQCYYNFILGSSGTLNVVSRRFRVIEQLIYWMDDCGLLSTLIGTVNYCLKYDRIKPSGL